MLNYTVQWHRDHLFHAFWTLQIALYALTRYAALMLRKHTTYEWILISMYQLWIHAPAQVGTSTPCPWVWTDSLMRLGPPRLLDVFRKFRYVSFDWAKLRRDYIFTWFWNLEFQAWPGRGRFSLWRFHSKNCWFLPSQHRKGCSSFVLTWAHRWHAYAWPLAVCQWLVQQQLRRCCEVPWWQGYKIWRDLLTVAHT